MKFVDGWACPDILSGPGKYAKRAEEDGILAVAMCKNKRVAIQAGGHVGTWPCFLSRHFDVVYTFEPTPDNFECLVLNIHKHAKHSECIFAARGALGRKRGPIDMVISGKSTGQHRARYPLDPELSSVPVYRIDDLALPVVDGIFLDVEGYENHALGGAIETLKRCRPVVMAENNHRAENQGFRMEDLEIFMRSADYRLAHTVGEDLIFVPI